MHHELPHGVRVVGEWRRSQDGSVPCGFKKASSAGHRQRQDERHDTRTQYRQYQAVGMWSSTECTGLGSVADPNRQTADSNAMRYGSHPAYTQYTYHS